MANKRFNKGNKRPEFDQKLLDLARVVRVVKGGRRFSFRATMIIGNRKGKVGLGVAQGSDVSGAINKAVEDAKKNMIIVKRLDSTISYRVDERFCGAQVMIKPAKDGKGIVDKLEGKKMEGKEKVTKIRKATKKAETKKAPDQKVQGAGKKTTTKKAPAKKTTKKTK